MNLKKTKLPYCYRAFGLTIGSSIEFPELLPADGEPDVVIETGTVPENLENPKKSGVRFQAQPGEFLLTVDNIARYLVLDGNRIVVHSFPNAGERDIRMFLLGSVFGALIHQRDMLPLHASAVKVGDGCVVFCGMSGFGKSTTALALVKRGYQLHADDICVVTMNSAENENKPLVFSAYPQMKLWQDALEKLGDKPADFQPVRMVLDKFAVPAGEQFNSPPLPVKKVYILVPWEKQGIDIVSITGMKKFNALKKHTYRFRFLSGLDKELVHFKNAGELGNRAPIALVYRPRESFLLDELCDVLEKDFPQDGV